MTEIVAVGRAIANTLEARGVHVDTYLLATIAAEAIHALDEHRKAQS